jgi:Bacterial SH3 domain
MFRRCIGIATLVALVFRFSPALAQDDPFDVPLYHITNAPNDTLALRTEPSFQRGLDITLVPNGTLVEVVERRKDRWWYVRLLPFGQEGWVLSGRGSRRWVECCRIGRQSSLQIALEEQVGFKTPTKNVYCVLEEIWLRCDVKPIVGPVSPKPPNCYLDWGDAFVVTPNSDGGYVLCHGDTVENDALPTLPYGSSWSRDGYTCMSDRTAVTCTNEESHGFRLSRTSRTVF